MKIQSHQKSRPILGAFWMILSGLSFVGVYIGVKYSGERLPAAQSAFLRYIIGLLFFIPLLPTLMREGITRAALRLGAWRGIIHTFAVTLWFFAMLRLPMTEVSAMGYLTPIFVTIGAVVFWSEKIALRRVLAIVVGFAGVLIILRPGFRELGLGHLAMILTTIGFAGSYLVAKRMTDVMSPNMVVAVLSVSATMGLAPLAAMNWVTPTVAELAWMAAVALCATGGHYFMTFALRAAPITVTQPMTFLQLIWASLFGFPLFDEAIDGFVILGGLIIIAAIGYITYRSAQIAAHKDHTD